MKHAVPAFFTVAILVASHAAADDSSDDEAYSCIVYKFVREAKTRDEAMIYCYENGGGSLVMINNQDEQDKVNELLDKVQPDSHVWTDGIRDECLTCFIWESTGSAVPWSNWVNEEPDNYNDSEECLHLLKGANWGWNDVSCYDKYEFVCQMDVESSE